MTTEITKPQPTGIQKVSQFLNSDAIKKKFTEVLGQKGTAFISSVLAACNQNELLKNATTDSIYMAALTAATLDLPINPNLGFAYIIPYKEQSGIVKAQFQVGYKGFIQLCLRSGQFETLSATPIYEGQIVSENPLTGYVFDFNVKSEIVVGYAAYFKLLNGFNKTFYLKKEQIENHAKRFSQSYKKGYGIWKDDFEGMAMKTVIKLLLSKYAPMSVEMQKAIITDQAVINTDESVEYADNIQESVVIDEELESVKSRFSECKAIAELDQMFTLIDSPDLREDIRDLYAEIKKTLPVK